jgi:hypothetical protein
MTEPWEHGGLHITDIDITIRGVGREDERTRYGVRCTCGWKTGTTFKVLANVERFAAAHEDNPKIRSWRRVLNPPPREQDVAVKSAVLTRLICVPGEQLVFGGLQFSHYELPGVLWYEVLFDRLIQRGKRHDGRGAFKLDGENGQCHLNAWKAHVFPPHHGDIATGFALSQAHWCEHSWVVSPEGDIIETTSLPRDAYFGYTLANDEVGPWFEGILLHNGRLLRKCSS